MQVLVPVLESTQLKQILLPLSWSCPQTSIFKFFSIFTCQSKSWARQPTSRCLAPKALLCLLRWPRQSACGDNLPLGTGITTQHFIQLTEAFTWRPCFVDNKICEAAVCLFQDWMGQGCPGRTSPTRSPPSLKWQLSSTDLPDWLSWLLYIDEKDIRRTIYLLSLPLSLKCWWLEKINHPNQNQSKSSWLSRQYLGCQLSVGVGCCSSFGLDQHRYEPRQRR